MMLPEVNNVLVLLSFNVIFERYSGIFAQVEHGGFHLFLVCPSGVICKHIDCVIDIFTIWGILCA